MRLTLVLVALLSLVTPASAKPLSPGKQKEVAGIVVADVGVAALVGGIIMVSVAAAADVAKQDPPLQRFEVHHDVGKLGHRGATGSGGIVEVVEDPLGEAGGEAGHRGELRCAGGPDPGEAAESFQEAAPLRRSDARNVQQLRRDGALGPSLAIVRQAEAVGVWRLLRAR